MERTRTATELLLELDALYRLSTDLIGVGGGDGTLKHLNASWERVLGYSKEEMIDKPWLDFVHDEDKARTIEAARALDRGDLLDFTNRYRCKDGRYVSLTWRCSAISGGLIFFIAKVS